MDAFDPHTLLIPVGLMFAAAVIGYASVYIVKFVTEIFMWVAVTAVISAVVSLAVVSTCQRFEGGCSLSMVGETLNMLFQRVFADSGWFFELLKTYYKMLKYRY
jgi:hypothetical protein